ncbi:transcriptional regulator with XRE-family HTH domain [Parabacteroides sp. PFB2-12]|uniref:XRE family transcriptional regulator n=1 Tax=unclassified Parabacteroides TaxID=2649774 RepID=UPI0024763EE6|nr:MULTISPECIES: XRE family transcriptional regulator [unclassified Parabacteroides]MDH6341351.1 transcriptional regulator with XRE-family HTH domain [Parabacteroides sp. PM6-13]MDH6389145.1 transcriptional regulator with XRE-family HTH domain [Parabacteroides sp. PFB2-12]
MLLAEKKCQLREEKQLLQRQVSAALEIDNALYCKIECGDRSAKRDQVIKLAELFQYNPQKMLVLWLADKLITAIEDDINLLSMALSIVKK